jgi:hypothetical protein
MDRSGDQPNPDQATAPTQSPAPPAPEEAPVTWAPSQWELADRAAAERGVRNEARGTSVLEGIAWVISLAAVLFFGRVFAAIGSDEPLSAYEWGVVAGSIFGALLVGLVVRWIWVKVRGRGRVLSPWVPIIAVVVLIVNLSRDIAERS